MPGGAISPHQADKVFGGTGKRKRYFPIRRSLTFGFEIRESPGPEQDAHALLKLFAIERLAFFDRKHVAQHLLVVVVYTGKVDSLDACAETASLRLRPQLPR